MSLVMTVGDHIVVLDAGTVIAAGTPLEVQSTAGLTTFDVTADTACTDGALSSLTMTNDTDGGFGSRQASSVGR